MRIMFLQFMLQFFHHFDLDGLAIVKRINGLAFKPLMSHECCVSYEENSSRIMVVAAIPMDSIIVVMMFLELSLQAVTCLLQMKPRD